MRIKKLMESEVMFYWYHKLMNSMFTIFTRVALEGKIDETKLRQAIKSLQSRHPVLRAYIKENKQGIFFYEIEDEKKWLIPFTVITKSYEDQWKDVGRDEAKKGFDVKCGPLMRIFLLKNETDQLHDLVLIHHHSIMDAASKAALIKDLLGIYSKIENNTLDKKDIGEIPLSESSLNIAMMEPLKNPEVAKNKNAAHEARNFLNYIYTPLKRILFLLFKKRETTLNSYQIRISEGFLNKDITARLLEACTAHNVTWSNLLAAAVLISIKKHNNKCAFPLIIPRSLRRFYLPPISDEALGCFEIAQYIQQIQPIDLVKDIWELATYLKNEFTTKGWKQVSINRFVPPKSKMFQIFIFQLIKTKIGIGGFFMPSDLECMVNYVGEYGLQNQLHNLSIKAYNTGMCHGYPDYSGRKLFLFHIIKIDGETHLTHQSNLNEESEQAANMQRLLDLLNSIC